MARPREFDITKAIEDISEKFWADGYEATGVAALVDVTGVGRASLYAAFGSKREMLHKAIDFYLSEHIEQVVSPIDDGGIDAVANWFRSFARVREMKPERATMGCLMVNSIVELGTSDPEVVALAERYRNRIRHAFDSALVKAVQDGEVDGDVDARADLATMMLMGLYVSIKSGGALGDIQHLCSVAVDVVESWRALPQGL